MCSAACVSPRWVFFSLAKESIAVVVCSCASSLACAREMSRVESFPFVRSRVALCSAGGVRRRTLVRHVIHILPYGPRCSVPSCVMLGSGASEKNNHPQDRLKVRTGPLRPISMLTVFRDGTPCPEKNNHFRPSLRAIRVNIEIGGAGTCAPRCVCHRDGCFFRSHRNRLRL